MTKTMQAANKLWIGLLCVIGVLIGSQFLQGCSLFKSADVKDVDVNSICENALVKQTTVIAAATFRNIPVQQYVDGLCKIASIVEPFIKDPLKPNVTNLGAEKLSPVDQALAAARKEGLIE